MRTIVCDQDNIVCVMRHCDACKGRQAYTNLSAVLPNVRKYFVWEKVTDSGGYTSTKCVEVSNNGQHKYVIRNTYM